MYLLEDSRQKIGKHEIKNNWWRGNGHKVLRCKLPFGDYAPPPPIAIDTKENMSEIANNIGVAKDHKRFREELKLAQLYGCKLVVLIENEDGIRSIEDVRRWKNPRAKYSSGAISGERLAKSMATMELRYGVKFMFCAPDEAGALIIKILEEYDGRLDKTL